MSSADPGKKEIGDVCPYCNQNVAELSDYGKLNHVDWCRIVVGVPDVKRSTPKSPEETPSRRGVTG